MELNVDHIAKLARIALSEQEKAEFGKQLSDILTYADNLNKLDLTSVLPTSHAVPLKNVLREDAVEPCQEINAIIANGPEIEENMFRVPRIIE